MLIFNAILPIFLIMLLGFAAEKYKLLGQNGAAVLNRFVFYFGLPLLIFTALSKQTLSSMFNLKFVLAFTLGMLISFSLIIFIKKIAFKHDSQAEVTIKSLLASMPNTGFMGIPILSALIGTTGIIAAVITTILMLILLLITLPWLEQEAEQKISLRRIIIPLIKQPLIIAMLIAFAFSSLQLHLPTTLNTTLKMIADTATPCALFAIGANLAEDKISFNIKDTCIISLLKLAIQPMITLAFMFCFHVPAQWPIAGVISASLPVATVVFVYAAQFKIYVKETSSVIAITTIASALTLPLFIFMSHLLWH